jgi:hypothetical protein
MQLGRKLRLREVKQSAFRVVACSREPPSLARLTIYLYSCFNPRQRNQQARDDTQRCSLRVNPVLPS